MDPVTVISTTTAVIGCTTKVIKQLHDLHTTLKEAPLLLSSIISECTTVHTSLCVIQDIQIKNAAIHNARADQISDTIDLALSSCTLIISVLEKDVQCCLVANKTPQDDGAVKRARLILEKDHLQELLYQLRGQQQALTLLLSTLQSRSIDEIRTHVQDNQDLLQGIAKVAKKFYVENEYDPSLIDTLDAADDSLDIDSVLTSTRFAFDAEILASKRYQRTLDYLHRIERRQTELSDSGTIRGGRLDDSHPKPSVTHPPEDKDVTPSVPTSSKLDEQIRLQKRADSITSQSYLKQSRNDTEPRSSSDKYLLPDISIEPWTLQIDAAVQNTSSGASGSEKFGHAFQRPETNALRHKQMVGDPVGQLSIFPFETEATKSLESLESNNRSQYRLSASSEASQEHVRAGSLSTTDSRETTPPQRPSAQWLDGLFKDTWINEDVASMYQVSNITRKEIVFVGDSGVGVTSAITRAVSGTWTTKYSPTILDEYSLDVTMSDARFTLKLWDTSSEHLDRLKTRPYTNANLVVIAYAIDNPDSLTNVRAKWVEKVSKICPEAPILLLGCKLDLRDNMNTIRLLEDAKERPVTYRQGLNVARRINADVYMECSSAMEEGGNITELFDRITKLCILHDPKTDRKRSRRPSLTRKLFPSKNGPKPPAVIDANFTTQGGQLVSRSMSIEAFHETFGLSPR